MEGAALEGGGVGGVDGRMTGEEEKEEKMAG